MKCQASITVDRELLLKIKKKVRQGYFRNQSHLFEFAAKRFIDQNQDTLKDTLREDKNE